MTDLIDTLNNKDVFINAIEFSEVEGVGEVLIHFQEKREVGETTAITKQMVMMMNSEERLAKYLDLQEIIADLIDNGYVTLRNPPQEVNG